MATLAETLRFSEFKVEIEDPANPGNWLAPCGLTSRGFNRAAAMNDTNVPYCPPDEDKPSWLERDVVSNSATLEGSGVVANQDFDLWDAWYEGGDSKNIRVTLGERRWGGAAKISALNNASQRGQRVTFTVTLVSDGPLVRQ